ncbi:glucose kinase [Mesoplasma florum L1]|uniref:Glucose kinase n=1 Tax=Mesoplasma florum (strain ATCC 33453 / NBRC 100688 / NCTC 11704 / L1) TaxID=265311 RepID=Q6F0W8_MESFL|nr:ROK family protein [Mesoplasma florum]AAT75855.1 glucose kinase [Mesoplasma florum L1]AVN61162.1 ROK family protein [Mesoplasma florum]AVN65224.1 ROK family protein [Mesoplasma florum]
MILNIDLGGNSAKCALIENFEIKSKFFVETPKFEIIENLKKMIDIYFKENGYKWENIEAISFSVPGAYDKKTEIIVFAGNLNWWNYPLLKEARRIFNFEKIFILNDANAATYGEWKKGQDGIPESMMLFTLGTGVGHGLILNKQIWEGTKKGYASEGGHGGCFADEELLCSCGVYGCLEAKSSATGIERELNKTDNKNYIESKFGKEFKTIKIIDIVELFNNEDPVIINIFKECLMPLSKAIGYLQTVLDVDKVIIGGGPSNLGERISEIIFENLKKYTLKSFYEDMVIEIAKLGNDAGIWGAYYWAVENIK